MAIAPITTSGPTITVSTAEELMDAYQLLSNQDGGGQILLEPGYYGGFTLYTYGVTDGDQPVVISSANPDDPADFRSFSFREVSNIRIENVHVDSTSPPDGSDPTFDLWIKDSSNIQIVDSVFLHDVGNELKDAGTKVDTFSHIRESSDILFEGNLVDGYFHGLQATEVSGLEVIGNEITNLQGDGFRGGGLQDLLIEGNYLHDFYGTDQSVNHSDLIQLWGSNAYTLTQNVTITGNILIANDAASQSIFIRNEEFGDVGDSTSGYFTNFTITDNLIYNAHRWGIHLDNIDGALVDNNTLLWNQDAEMVVSGTPYSDPPEIFVRNSLNIEVTDNITGALYLPDGSTSSGNEIVNFTNPQASNYVDKHFVNALAGADVTLEDLYMLPSSPWYGEIGSSIGVYLQDISEGVLPVISPTWSEDDQYEMTYDASLSLDADGATSNNPAYTYHWTFGDGTTAEGLTVTKLYDSGGFKSVELEIRLDGEVVATSTRNYDVVTKDIFTFDFEGGLVDLGDGDSQIIDNGTLTDSHDGQGYLIGDGNKLEIGTGTQGLYKMDSFGLALDLTPTGDEPAGTFLELYRTMEGKIYEDGRFNFMLTTDEGTYSLTSRDPIFDDGGTHRIGIAFDGTTGQLELFADGESVSSTEAWGTTPSVSYYNLIFGRTFKDSMDAVIDNVEMSTDPSVAGTLPEVEPPADEPPVNDPPAEEPPADEPPADDPPVEEPPQQDPPAEDEPTDDRDAPREEIESSGSSNFLSNLLDMFLRIFGLGGDDDAPASQSAAAYVSEDTELGSLVPMLKALDDDLPEEDVDDETLDIAA